MPQVYKDGYSTLESLLHEASNSRGASLLIPDLQRPYVWTPLQVVYLVDSLIRGWPFGSLLLWSVSEGSMATMPSRQFATLVDRVTGEDRVVPQQQAPANYRMVLDGQQRVQSLLLAFGGDSWGFKMEDRAWHEALNGKRPRGRYRHAHWSVGELCLDLIQLNAKFASAGSVSALEFASVLRWVIRDPKNGQSSWPKRSNYDEPLLKRSQASGRFIPLSRIWSALSISGTASLAQLREATGKLIQEHEVGDSLNSEVRDALMEVLQAIQAVKGTRVTYLEVLQHTQDMGPSEVYSDAIVTIFTRLNTAGRTLTREEITFAWVKANWDITATESKGAAECFKDLGDQLRDKFEIDLSVDELVSAVSLVWAVNLGDGRLLSNADLLKGDSVKPMARQIATNWKSVVAAAIDVCGLVKQRGYKYGRHYQSLNSLALLWAWRFMGVRQRAKDGLREPERDAWDKTAKDGLNLHVDRWLVCSQWAGAWGESATAYITSIVAKFSSVAAIVRQSDEELAKSAWLGCLKESVDSFSKDAGAYIETLDEDAREYVRAYYLPLWMWHRLEEPRWAASSIPLRTRKADGTLDVDHILSVGMAEQVSRESKKALEAASNQLAQQGEERDADVNPLDRLQIHALGNCWLLETNFNISKGKKSATAFLGQVAEFKDNLDELESWRRRMGLEIVHINPTANALLEIEKAINERTRKIRDDLKRFVDGTGCRVDLHQV